MIVEDQALTVEYLEKLIPWEDLGFPIVARAGNGREALDMLGRVRPDIILADVEMPVVNGLDFSRQAVKQFPWLQILIVSSHRQFDYVKQAIGFGAADYILKHEINEKNLIPRLEQARGAILSRLSGFAASLERYYGDRQREDVDPIGAVYFCEDDLWIFGTRGDDFRGAPVSPPGIDAFQLSLSVPLGNKGILLFYRSCHRKEIAGSPVKPALRDIASELMELNRQAGTGEGIYMIDYISESRHYLSRIFDRITTIEQFRDQLPDFIVLHGELLERLIRKDRGASVVSRDRGRTLAGSATAFIGDNYMRPIGTADVADGIGVSTAYLCQKFKEETGETILKALTRRRIDRAKELLAQGYVHVNEISEACGFSSPRYFSQVFRKTTGKTPTEFRDASDSALEEGAEG